MKNAWVIRTIVCATLALLVVWIVNHTSWVEIEEVTPPTGAAARPDYALRKVAAAAGATLEHRSALEPMPPPEATLFLDSLFWNLFPERDEKLKAWVAGGGHLVLLRQQIDGKTLRWLPPTFARRAKVPATASATSSAASARIDHDENDDDEDDDLPVLKQPLTTPLPRTRPLPLMPRPEDKDKWLCETMVESSGSQAAFEPGRTYQRCLKRIQYVNCVDQRLVPDPHARPEWVLGNEDRTFAIRVPSGKGSVTVLADCLPINNDAMLVGDHALIAAAVLNLRPGATLWIVDEEAGEPLPRWLWHHARSPLLLTLAAIALSLWRLMVRFGPRRAVAPRARRSMAEQIRGTGQFIASNDPQALHAATRQAFDDVARTRLERYADLTDSERVIALGARTDPRFPLDKAALLPALHPGPRPTGAQWLAAIAAIEQARRVLLRAAATPPRP
jgi:hypothetical protein